MSADVAEVVALQAEEVALGVKGKPGIDMQVAGLIVAGKRLLPFGHILDGPAKFLRRDAEQHKIRIEAVAGAETAADVPMHDAKLLAIDAEHGRQIRAQMHRPAAACGVER
jgi:hypothetical protein